METGWIGAWSQQQSLSANNIGHMGQAILSDTAPETAAARSAIVTLAWSNFLSNTTFVLTAKFSDVMRLVAVFGSQLSATQQQQLIAPILQRCSSSTPDLALVSIQHMNATVVAPLRSIGATDVQLASLIAAWAVARDQRTAYTVDDGGPVRQTVSFNSFGKGSTAQAAFFAAIAAQVQADGGMIGPNTAYLLSFCATASNQLPAWMSQLNSQLQATNVAGDSEALLLLSQADAIDPVGNSLAVNAAAQQALQQALASAQSPKVQVACCEGLVHRLVMAKNYTQAQSYLTSLQAQLTDPSALANVNTLTAFVAESAARDANQAAQQAQLAALGAAHGPTLRLQGRLAYLQSKLAAAQAQQAPSAEIQALSASIANIQEQLAALPVIPPTTSPSQ